ncbi:MAG: SRPBCC family protein [Bacteroidia bacterium]|nr:SRPBCC family protein [Bacteroidia bacterium]
MNPINLEFKSNKTPEEIFSYLSDMTKFASVHPVISKIDKLQGGNYLVYETLKFAGIPISFTYPVVVLSDSEENQVCIRATVMKITKIEMNISILSKGGGSLIKEEISFKSFLPVKKIMAGIFRKQHAELFDNIEKDKLK